MMLLYVCLFAVGHAALGKTIQEITSIQLCRRSDPQLNTCLLQQAGPIIKKLKHGIPELGLEPIDPYKVDFMAAEGDLEMVKVKMIMKNITLSGHTDGIQFTRLKFDPITNTGEVAFYVPYYRMTCDYFATGRLFVIPLESSAHFDGNITGTNMTISFRLNTIQKKGKEYFTVDKMNTKMYVESAHIKLISIDPANQQQVNVIQDIFNENNRLVLDTVNPIVNEYDDEYAKYIADSYLRRLPADEIFPK